MRAEPFVAENVASRARRMRRGGVRPRGLPGLLNWFLVEWAQEVPSRIHGRGVWRDYVPADADRKSGGGSQLGAPADSDGFRRYIYNRATELNEDGDYVRPVHAALFAMGGHRQDTEHGSAARWLGAVAAAGGDWASVGYRRGLEPWVSRIVTETALNRLFDHWRPAPLPREESVA